MSKKAKPILMLVGMGLVGFGCWQLSPPAAMIVVGVLIIVDAAWDRGSSNRTEGVEP